jgi:hypothetical protein
MTISDSEKVKAAMLHKKSRRMRDFQRFGNAVCVHSLVFWKPALEANLRRIHAEGIG